MAGIKEVNEIIEDIIEKAGSKGPSSEYNLVYDSTAEAVEQIYFYLLDLLEDFGYDVEKVIDNFTSAPGSTHFADIGTRATRMQDEAMKILGSVNAVLKSILNMTYDMKDMRTRLRYYEDLKDEKKDTAQAARLTLKQIWMDKVDIQKGNSSVKVMSLGQAGFQTLLDAFLAADSPDEAERLDLNDRVKRIVKARLEEFEAWLKFSEQELKKRYELEKNYLKNQIASLKLYSRWVRPYLRATESLTMKEQTRNPDVVNIFNTVVLELTLLGKKELKIDKAVVAGDLPLDFSNLKTRRKYYSCVLIDFRFRLIPLQGRFSGRSEITFRSYSLSEDDIVFFEKELDSTDIGYALKLIGASDDSLKAMEEDIKSFLEEESPDEKEKEDKKEANPFLALFGFYDKKDEKKEEKKKEKTEKDLKDNWIEKNYLRKVATNLAADITFQIFDIYKKAHGMPSYVT